MTAARACRSSGRPCRERVTLLSSAIRPLAVGCRAHMGRDSWLVIALPQVTGLRQCIAVEGRTVRTCASELVPPAGFEPAHTALYAFSLSPELLGLSTEQVFQS